MSDSPFVSVNFDLGKLAKSTGKIHAELINDIGDVTVQAARAGFGAEKDPDGKGWKALKPKTVKRKGKSDILFDTGKMAKGIFLAVRATASKLTAIIRPSKDRMAIASFHQAGSGTLPQRKIFPTKGLFKRSQKQVNLLLKTTELKLVASVKTTRRVSRG